MVEQVANQQSGGGSTPTPSLHFSKCKLEDVSEFVRKNHYSHTYPGGIDFSFSAHYGETLVGACLFGYGASRNLAEKLLRGEKDKHKFRELVRLVFLDEVPRNSESKFISWCLKFLAKNTELLAIVSFADSSKNHVGYVYQASNWLYTGESIAHHKNYLLDGKDTHERTLYSMYGKFSYKELKEKLGDRLQISSQVVKHRYIYLLRPELRERLLPAVLPYPKKKNWLDDLEKND